MKTRNGFVSNSSSTSFIINGWKIPVSTPKEIENAINILKLNLSDIQKQYFIEDENCGELALEIEEHFKEISPNFVATINNDATNIFMGIGEVIEEGVGTLLNKSIKKEILEGNSLLEKTLENLGESHLYYGVGGMN